MSKGDVFARYQHLIRPIAARLARLLPGHSLEDLQQSGAVGLLEAASKYDHRRARTFAQLAKMRIRGAILDSLARSRLIANDADSPEASEDGVAFRAAHLAEMHVAIAGLSREQREILELHYAGEMSLRAAGRAAGISLAAARRREQRALAALRKRMVA